MNPRFEGVVLVVLVLNHDNETLDTILIQAHQTLVRYSSSSSILLSQKEH